MGTFAIPAIPPSAVDVPLRPAPVNNLYQQHQDQVRATNQKAARNAPSTDAMAALLEGSVNTAEDGSQAQSDADSTNSYAQAALTSYSDSEETASNSSGEPASVADEQAALTAYADDDATAIDNDKELATNDSSELAAIANAQHESQIQIALAASILNPPGSAGVLLRPTETAARQVIDVLNATNSPTPATETVDQLRSTVGAVPASAATDSLLTSTARVSVTAATPYDRLLSAIDAGIAAHPEAVPVAPVRLKISGNFVNSLV